VPKESSFGFVVFPPLLRGIESIVYSTALQRGTCGLIEFPSWPFGFCILRARSVGIGVRGGVAGSVGAELLMLYLDRRSRMQYDILY
jgi:hypothetical protein